MRNAERIYREYMNRIAPMKMTLVILEQDGWTNNFAIIKTDWEDKAYSKFAKTDYTIFWIDNDEKLPQPIRAYSDLSKALSAFHLLRYEAATYTEYPF